MKGHTRGPSYMFPVFMLCFMSAFLMTAIVVKSSSSRLRPTNVSSDDIRRLSIHYNLMQLYSEFNDLMSKLSLCERVHNDMVKDIRYKVIQTLATDMEDVNFKMQDVFRVMNTQFDLRYSSFENYMGRIDYEEELSREISTLI